MPANLLAPSNMVSPSAIGIDAAAVAASLNISESHLFALLRTGRFGPEARRLGRASATTAMKL